MTRRLALLLAAVCVLVLGGTVVGYLYVSSRNTLLAEAENNLRDVALEAAREADDLFQPAVSTVMQLQSAGLHEVDPAEAERIFFSIASYPVRANPQLAGVYIGLPDGSFLHAQSLIPTDLAATDAIPPGYDGLIRRILRQTGPERGDAWLYRDAVSGEWERARVTPPGYDPRLRPWYRKAVEQNGPAWSDPYVFASTGEIGITLAVPVRLKSGALWGVVGVDIAVSSLSQIILAYRERRIGKNGFLFIGDDTGRLIAHSHLLDALAKARESPDSTIEAATDIRNVYRENGDDLVLFKTISSTGTIYRADNGDRGVLGIRLRLDDSLLMPMLVYVGQPIDDIIGDAISRLQRNIALLAGLAAIFLIVAVYAAKLRHEVATRKRTEIALAQARDTAEEATRAKSSFLAMMSHEIRTPMNGVMSMAEMLDQTDLTEDQRGMSSVIRSSASALLTIINDILDFSKIEAGKLDIETTPFSLLEIVEGAGELIAARAEEKGIGLVIDLDTSLPDRLEGDPTRLRQILLNLMGNAVKFTEAGEVTLKVTPLDTAPETVRLRFEVIDTGIGLTAEQQSRLFQAFAQADTSTSRRFGGTGLGLSISQRLCGMMGGKIGVDSTPGTGSTFWFELPFAVNDPAPPVPSIAIDDAQIAAIGFQGAERHALAKALGAAGIDDQVWHDSGPAFPSSVTGRSVVLARASAEAEATLDLVRVFSSRSRPEQRVILVAPRSLASTLMSAEQKGFFATLTLPIRRQRLWHVIAAAMGRVELGQRQAGAASEAVGWAPPTVEEARAAGALILVAEDNATNQTVIRRLLNQRGFAHEIAGNGIEALRLLDRHGHGLLLTDFHMPEMDGFQLTAEIRRQEKDGARRMPIVALTADALPGTEQRCLDAGMDGYLTKPIDSQALTAALEKFLPQAMPLRRRPGDGQQQSRPVATGIDPAILDLAQLSEIFGGLNDDARSFLANLVDDLPRMIADIADSLASGDRAQARDAAHALKGAARSAGLSRLGQIASDIQDHLDNGDLTLAGTLHSQLPPAYDELQTIVRTLQPEFVKA